MSKLNIIMCLVLFLTATAIAQSNDPYACLGEAQGVIRIEITDRSLKRLESKKIPPDVINKLALLKGREFIEREKFLDTLRAIIGNRLTQEYQGLIIKLSSTRTSVDVIRR